MPLIRQNFSIAAGDDKVIDLDINPDVTSMVGDDLTFRAYEQQCGVKIGDPVITKNLDDGLEISDPDYGIVLITFGKDDTYGFDPRNLAFEITDYDIDGNRVTVTEGIMTILRTANPKTKEDLRP